MQGWAPPALLESYEAERHPVAQRNTAFARAMANSIGSIAVSPVIEEASAAGEAARAALGKALAAHVAGEFNIPGLQLGVRYQSAIVAPENGTPPADQPNVYVPSTYPGARAPHVRIGEASLLDYFGRDFTLLAGGPADTAAWEAASLRFGLPMVVLRSDDKAVRAQYSDELVLIRPDHHIAWRGKASADAEAVLARAIALGTTTAPTTTQNLLETATP